MNEYQTFLAGKRTLHQANGIVVADADINPMLFPFQRALVKWAAMKGRAAMFCDTGLGKTFMQIEWARLLGQKTLVIAPLSVARQTSREAWKLGIEVPYVRNQSQVSTTISVTNYEMLEHFDPAQFGAVVLDESSILKGLDGATREKLTDMFGATPYRLCCTATPAPNDITEIANHAEFLGILSRVEMLAMFFVHDDNGWRLKGHAHEPFFRWLASWAMSVKKPSDIGYSDDGYILPALTVTPEWVESGYVPDGQLFATGLKGITDRAKVRKGTAQVRVERAAALMSEGQWIAWCGLNEEGRALKRLIPDAVLVEGNQSPEEKAAAIEAFQVGTHRVMITKPSIAGMGLNFQQCHQMAFVGLSDSWEAYYQSIRRCWRFGQQHPVDVRIVISDAEEDVYLNVMQKEEAAADMTQRLIDQVRDFEQEELGQERESWQYTTNDAHGEQWKLMLGDSTERLGEIAAESVGLSVFSPPFMSLYTYSPTERDLGNSRDEETFFTHFGYIIDHLLRVTKPGRECCVHVAQVPAMLVRDGYIGVKDFRGKTINAFESGGWVYHGEVVIDKDPQAQAIRTHSKALLFTQLKRDSSWLRPALADYILVFRKPGQSEPIKPEISNEQWIEWARPIWYGIKETNTLNYRDARSDDDERHIAPLQLDTIERCIQLWSNPGDLVLSPFAGIGSEGFMSVKLGRRFVGCELKPEYFGVAVKNLRDAEQTSKTGDLFSMAGLEVH